jgi:hypothetical protein
MIIGGTYSSYFVTCAHCILDYETNTDERKQFNELLKDYDAKKFRDALYIVVGSDEFPLNDQVLNESFVYLDENVDLAVIPVPSSFLEDAQSFYEMPYSNPSSIDFNYLDYKNPIFAKHVKNIRFYRAFLSTSIQLVSPFSPTLREHSIPLFHHAIQSYKERKLYFMPLGFIWVDFILGNISTNVDSCAC